MGGPPVEQNDEDRGMICPVKSRIGGQETDSSPELACRELHPAAGRILELDKTSLGECAYFPH